MIWHYTQVVIVLILLSAPAWSASEKHGYLRQSNLDTEATESETQSILQIAVGRALGGGLSGAAAGAIQVVSLMWLRTAMNYQYRFGGSLASVMQTLWSDGGFLRFYRGLAFALVQGPLARFGATAANEAMVAIVASLHIDTTFGVISATILASFASGLWRFIITPLDTLKTVLQVDGDDGFHTLLQKLRKGDISYLYAGAFASVLATVVGHYPWFATFNMLNQRLPVPSSPSLKILRSAFVGLSASVTCDLLTNWIRVVKTHKQTYLKPTSYSHTTRIILANAGVRGLFFRGLGTRMLVNGLQSILFAVLWRFLYDAWDHYLHFRT